MRSYLANSTDSKGVHLKFHKLGLSTYCHLLDELTPEYRVIDGERFDAELVEATSSPTCVKVTPKRLGDFATPLVSTPIHRPVRASPRVFPSPHLRDALRVSPLVTGNGAWRASPFGTPSSTTSSKCPSDGSVGEGTDHRGGESREGSMDRSRVIRGRASRKLSFEGQSEGECAQASGELV